MGAILLWRVSQLATCEAVNAGEEAPLSRFIVELVKRLEASVRTVMSTLPE
jgi:hypothetical protein